MKHINFIVGTHMKLASHWKNIGNEKIVSGWIARWKKSAVREISNPKIRNTSSKHTQCKAGMKLKKIYDDAKEIVISVRIGLLHLDHNHEFFKKDTEREIGSNIFLNDFGGWIAQYK
jgi:hypothetical protein